MTDHITLEVSRDGWTGGLQLSINCLDDNGTGHAFRIAGPKMNGSSEPLLVHEVRERDADEILAYLALVPPRQAVTS